MSDALTLYGLLRDNLPGHDYVFGTDANGHTIATFNPPLSAADQVTADDLTTMARFGVTLSLAEWQAIKPDVANLKTYLGLASPTNAQSVAAIRSIIRVLATIVRS